MAIAFVTIKVQVGQVREILSKIRTIENVIEAYSITGPYDIILKIEGDNLENLAKMVVTEIHEISGVQDTVTYLVVDLEK
ncbi:MAG: Lrp/AsnC ligand binding domain-containing protein [Candidatus Helarchaeota archaeon]|nr:Lrp/AsnC ligand binding domain-containing protein [Candidatus Helarchaeota archaeon]